MNDFKLNLEFDLEKNKSNVIKVIGVGGGGGNAVNYMYAKGVKDVDFVVINTDAQDLSKSPIPIKIQIGKDITEGLGAGANPEIGEKAAIENIDAIKSILENNTKMIFITAGMGGGTGTGAAPIIAKLAKEMGILTVGIVTSPFMYEGKKRNLYAQKGIENLREYVDSLIIINNNKLREIYGNLTYKEAFAKSDEVLASAATSIAEVITHNYMVNVDFRDVKTVLEDSGTAIMGSARAAGENRAKDVIMSALDSPLLNDNKISGAKNVLLLIVSGKDEITIDEISEINDYIQDEAGNNADVIMGIGEDESLGDAISVTIIATGFNKNQQDLISNSEPDKIVHVLDHDTTTFADPTEITAENKVSQSNETSYVSDVSVEENSYGNLQYPKNFEQDDHTGDLSQTPPIIDEITSEEEIKLIHKDEVENSQQKTSNEKPEDKKPLLLFDLEDNDDSSKYDQVEDLTELPLEVALRLKKERKQNLKNYATHLNISDEDDIPAFKKKGIKVDLSPKSSENVHKIEMDMDGNFKLRDTNSFLDDNVD
jgi:cell division protein FtsZ